MNTPLVPRGGVVLALGLLACGEAGEAGALAEPAPFVKTLPPDEHGVRVAGSETGDIYFADYADDRGCIGAALTRLGLAQALERGLPVQQRVAALEQPLETSLRWGDRCPRARAGLPVADTRIEIRRQVVEVEVTTHQPVGDTPPELCPDDLRFRSVVSLRTADGAIEGRFYSRTAPDGLPFELFAKPDLRNFDGTLAVPIDLAQPHDSALDVWLQVTSDGEPSGHLSVLLRYAGDPEASFLGLEGVFPAPDAGVPSPDSRCNTPLPANAALVPLSRYDGSAEDPYTCFGSASYWAADRYHGPVTSIDVGAVRLLVDDLEWPVRPGIPLTFGPVRKGANVRLDVQNPGTTAMAFVQLFLGTYEAGYPDAVAACTGEGCVASVEGVRQGYCF